MGTNIENKGIMAHTINKADKGKIKTTLQDIAHANEQIQYWKRVSNAHGFQLAHYKSQAIKNAGLTANFTVTNDLKIIETNTV